MLSPFCKLSFQTRVESNTCCRCSGGHCAPKFESSATKKASSISSRKFFFQSREALFRALCSRRVETDIRSAHFIASFGRTSDSV